MAGLLYLAQLRLVCSELGRDLLGDECLDLVALLHIAEAGEAHAALHAVGDLTRIVLEPLERCELALEDLLATTHHADFRIATDGAVGHAATGDGAHLGNAEDLLYQRATLIALLEDWIEQSQHRLG